MTSHRRVGENHCELCGRVIKAVWVNGGWLMAFHARGPKQAVVCRGSSTTIAQRHRLVGQLGRGAVWEVLAMEEMNDG
jgi:hypothetical protein